MKPKLIFIVLILSLFASCTRVKKSSPPIWDSQDYEEGITLAQRQNKPALVYFNGIACAQCRYVEADALSDDKVKSLIKEKFIIISLLVDDRNKLEQENDTIINTEGAQKKTVGEKWSDLQQNLLNTNIQPYFVILDTKQEILAKMGYPKDAEDFLGFLNTTLEQYR
jgi:thiol:disulfide interchange protein DsbD